MIFTVHPDDKGLAAGTICENHDKNMSCERKTFAEKVYAVVAKIPRGRTMTYGEVARRAGSPRAYRAVGNILNKNRNPKVPCHRVIRSDGDPGGFAWGRKRKIMILRREGATI